MNKIRHIEFLAVFIQYQGMEKLQIWSESCEVRFGAIDSSDLMTLDAVFDFFQEVAISHAENLGVGREAMANASQAWILSRMSVLVERRPKYGEIITVRTWPRSTEKLFALRDYDIRDANDSVAVRARSCWLIIDMEKRRPLRPQAVVENLPQNEGMDSLPAVPGLEEKLTPQTDGLTYTERKALYADLDYNRHVNNASYIRWIEDIVDIELLEKAKQIRLDINYMNEVLPGELTGIWSSAIEKTTFAFEGKKLRDNQPAFRAELRLW